jgi:hypothetical protein
MLRVSCIKIKKCAYIYKMNEHLTQQSSDVYAYQLQSLTVS